MNKKTILQALKFLRITDEKGNLSLTNVALFAALYNIATKSDAQLNDLLMFVASIAGYQAKRYISGEPEDSTVIAEKIREMETKITALQIGKMLKK